MIDILKIYCVYKDFFKDDCPDKDFNEDTFKNYVFKFVTIDPRAKTLYEYLCATTRGGLA